MSQHSTLLQNANHIGLFFFSTFGLTQLIYNELGSISTKKNSLDDATPSDSPPQLLGDSQMPELG
jgi:hypothetical protein